MTKKEYDFAFSLGFSCGTTQALRAAGLQYASYPLDWAGAPSLDASVRMIEADFAHWLDCDDLELWDVRHGPGFCTRIYRNRRTGFGFSHEFSDFEPFARTYPKVCATYDRRIARFRERLASARRILAVYLELPFRSALPEPELRDALARLRAKCPAASVDLVYVCEDPACRTPVVRSERDGLTVLGCDYRKFDRDEITHFVDTDALAAWLRASAAVADARTDADRRKFAADMKVNRTYRWGRGGAFRSWINQRAYKLYRHLERTLQNRGLTHREGPLWFVDR